MENTQNFNSENVQTQFENLKSKFYSSFEGARAKSAQLTKSDFIAGAGVLLGLAGAIALAKSWSNNRIRTEGITPRDANDLDVSSAP